MATERQTNANRANALKSTGPSTPEGLAISSRNSLRHGMLSRTIILDGESAERFASLMAEYHEEFQPVTPTEHSLVESLVVARWRQMRLWSLEQAAINLEIRKQQIDNAHLSGEESDAPTRAAIAFRTLGDNTGSLDRFNRYEARYDRQYNRALDRLLALREKK